MHPHPALAARCDRFFVIPVSSIRRSCAVLGALAGATEQPSSIGDTAMKVVRLHRRGDLRIAEEAIPEAEEGSSLVRITSVGICGSDLHWYTEGAIGDARLEHPLVICHEFAGTAQSGPLAGRRVAIDPADPCMICATCRRGLHHLCPQVVFAGHGVTDGALREYIAWPTRLLFPLPDMISNDDGALLEPLGVAVHAIDLGRVRLGSSVIVVGCGPIGLLLVQAARAAGASAVVAVEPLAHRRDAARRYGADVALRPDEADQASLSSLIGEGVDVAFEAAGTDDALHVSLMATRPGGRVVELGIPDLDHTSFTAALARRKGLTILMSRRMNDVYDRAIRLVESGRIDVTSLISAHYPLDSVSDAFDAAVARTGLKIVVDV
jgi:L-iditol 2-dehydrogenase